MKEKVRIVYEQAGRRAGLRLDEAHGVLYGQRDGFQILAYPASDSALYQLQVSVSASRPAGELTKEERRQFPKETPCVAGLTQEGSGLSMTLHVSKQPDRLGEYLNDAITALIGFLRRGGWQPCCRSCRQVGNTEPYVVSDAFLQLCPTCAAAAGQSRSTQMQQETVRKENLPGGILGALLGSLVGVLSIILFSRLGRVAALSGLLMAVCSLKGYELLGKKLSKKGVAICVIIMILMTFVGDLVDWAIMLAWEMDINFFLALRMMPYLLVEGYMEGSGYAANLVLLYIFAALGAVPTIRNVMKQKQTAVQFEPIGSYSGMPRL